ncbi:MAG: TonB-dependent receptor [bacterium]|nr:TonB-dependent receptor [Candidatus Limimorpha caballi]
MFMFFAMAFSASAQDTIMLQSVEIKAVAIKSDRLETTMERRMDTSVIKRLGSVPMSQLLIQHSPVFIKTYGPGGIATASFRGTTASHTLVLWNGFQLNAPSLGQVDFSTIPVFMTDNISLKWGSGTSTNNGGLGGVVSISNDEYFCKGLIVNLKQTYGSFNTLGSYATLGYSWANHLLRVKAYRTSSDNDFKYINIGVIPHQEMKQKNADYADYGVMPEYQWRFGNSLITIVSWNQKSHRNCPQIMPNVGNDNTVEYTDNDFSRNYISFKNYWNTGKIEVKSSYFFENQHYVLNTFTDIGTPVTTTDSKNTANVFHQIADVEQNLFRSWKINAKIQWDHEQVKSNDYDGVKKRDVFSTYAALNGNVLRNIGLRATLRNDIVDGKSVGFFPTATVSYSCAYLKGLKISAGYSHNYRNPSLNDLYWNPGGNPDLRPEDGRTVDGNLNFTRAFERLSVESQVGAYYSQVSDWIQWKPTNYRYWVSENVSTVTACGAEIHLKMNYKLGLWNFSVSGNYVYSHTTDENDKQLIYIPLHHANAFADIEWKGWNFSYTMEFTGERKTSMNDNEFYGFRLMPYALHHVSVGKHFWKLDIELKINNLTDEDYQAILWRAMPGRSYEVSLNFKL